MKRYIITFVLAVATLLPALAQFPIEMMRRQLQNRTSFDMKTDAWNAMWIEVPGTQPKDYGVYYFRKDVDLNVKPSKFVVYVSGDTRYKLFVNGELASLGPARNDSKHWNYETVDLAPYLKAGKNVFAAQVWHEGNYTPVPNATMRSGFLMMGEGDAKVVNTDETWKAIQDPAYTPIRQQVPGYYALGAGEQINMNKTIADWMDANADLNLWQDAKPYELGTPHDTSSGTGVYTGHMLVPSTLPQIERFEKRIPTIRKDGGLKLPKGWPSQQAKVTIPANKKVELLLDQEELTNGFFQLNFSKGNGAGITIRYAEALYTDERGQHKGNRNEVEGKNFIGRFDNLTSNGKDNQQFTSLDWRTFRYVRLDIETKGEALEINDISSMFTGFPFKMNAQLDTDNQELLKMMEIGWRTARLCAIETYTDCPYYEQLQYLGDTRIQALVSIYNSGDDTLWKNYLRQADMSRNAEGVTMGRAPSELAQYITPYALSYIYSIHDYMRYGKDQQLVLDLIPGAEQILHYFSKYQMADGRIKGLPGWNFSDWVYSDGWQMGVAQVGKDGGGILMDLQLLLALQMMTELENYRGNTFMAEEYSKQVEQLKQSVQQAYWDDAKGLYAQTSEKQIFSQHANSLAILTGMVTGEQAKQVAEKMLTDSSLSQCSVYYKFYLHEALVKAGLGDDYLKWLDIWRENIRQGLSTWGETSDVDGTRSDCHAWGASPNIEFFRTLLGIDSAAPQFAKVKIEPRLGDLTKIGGSMPHPQGNIKVSYQKSSSTLKAEIELPSHVSGTLIWAGKSYELHGGKNIINAN
ncbi:MAG: alpha-L-rhamnosidase N-terminal domain-containing protein [Bacteroidaceae bacterium]|nr:alpha-L-rhamnosidase N-terminal domain-containing protein [Bacteroidaceae bacterium]